MAKRRKPSFKKQIEPSDLHLSSGGGVSPVGSGGQQPQRVSVKKSANRKALEGLSEYAFFFSLNGNYIFSESYFLNKTILNIPALVCLSVTSMVFIHSD